MKAKERFKKGTALVLTAAMVLGLAPTLPGIDISAHAEGTGSTLAPSLDRYASLADLTGTAFIPKEDGSQTIAKLRFGKNDSGATQEWYIVGPDSGISGKNVALFAASNMLEAQAFNAYDNTDSTKRTWSSDEDGKYSDGEPAKKLMLWTHYGVSDIRKTLQNMTKDGNTKYFTAKENAMLQDTTVPTLDDLNYVAEGAYKRDLSSYTTSDKLYLVTGNNYYTDETYYEQRSYLFVGKGSIDAENRGIGYGLEMSKYWSEGNSFWLREPYYDYYGSTSTTGDTILGGRYVLYTSPGSPWWAVNVDTWGVDDVDVDETFAIRPATNISLEDVLFASAADASVNIDEYEIEPLGVNRGMTLRFDGEGDAAEQEIGGTIGKVELSNGIINTTRGSTEKKVMLMVQGNIDGSNWCFSKVITQANAGEPITADIIRNYISMVLSDVDSTKYNIDSNSRIWLEVTGDDGMIYAVKAEGLEQEHQHVYGWKYEGDKHWQECTDPDCPDTDKGKKNEGTHKHTDTGTDDWEHDGDKHWQICDDCGAEFNEGDHTYSDSEHPNICDGCGYDRKHNPFPLKEYEAKDATETEDGNILYWECTECKKKYKDPYGIVEITDDSWRIPAKGHTLGDYEHDETSHWQICSSCGEKVGTTAHTFSGNKCTVCGYTKSSDNGDDGSSRNSDRYKKDTSSSSGGSGGSGGGGSSTINNNSNTSADGSTPEKAINGNGGTWEQDGNGWKYKYATGQYAAGTASTDANGKETELALWVKINGKEFAFGADGYMKLGWVQDAIGRWWYCDAVKGRLLGWIYDESVDKWYYVDESKGRLYGWFYDTEASYWYYLDLSTGEMLTGWQLINGKQYYFAPKPPRTTYSLDASSVHWHYDNPSDYRPYGSMYANTVTPDNHQVDADGAKIQ